MLKSVDLTVALNTHLEQHVAERVKVVVRLRHLEVGLLGIRGDRQSPSNVLFFRLCFSLTINGVRGLDAFMTIKMSSFLSPVECLSFNMTR